MPTQGRNAAAAEGPVATRAQGAKHGSAGWPVDGAIGFRADGRSVIVPTVRDALNELVWRHDALDEVVVWYIHRGAPDDHRAMPGDRILGLGHSFMHIEGPRGGTHIPYHRILRVERNGRPVWLRHSRTLDDLLKDERG